MAAVYALSLRLTPKHAFPTRNLAAKKPTVNGKQGYRDSPFDFRHWTVLRARLISRSPPPPPITEDFALVH